MRKGSAHRSNFKFLFFGKSSQCRKEEKDFNGENGNKTFKKPATEAFISVTDGFPGQKPSSVEEKVSVQFGSKDDATANDIYSEDEITGRISTWLKGHPFRDHEISNIADFANDIGIPDQRLKDYFKYHIKRTFRDWKTYQRLEDVKSLLVEYGGDAKLPLIMKITGYKSKSSLERAFRAEYGYTPREWLKINFPETFGKE